MNKHSAILITGGAHRLGRATALHFADHGYDVALHYRSSESEARETAALIEAKGVRYVLLQADLTQEATLEPLVAEAFTALPHLSALINNASAFPRKNLAETTSADVAAMMAIHVTAPMLLSRAFAARRTDASILMMADSKTTETHGSHFAYLLSKKSLLDLVPMLARALAPARINALCPGTILPDAHRDEAALARHGATLPLGLATPEDIATTARMIVENRALTGNVLYVDGGEQLL